MTALRKSRVPSGLDSPQVGSRRGRRGLGELSGGSVSSNETFGRWTEAIARGMGTPWFLLVLTLFCLAWLVWNTVAPEAWRFDSAALGFTALTLILSLQASYAAPMILLAQNRQDDRDRVQIEQDRQRAERNLADTEFLAREVVALRLAIKDLPDRDFVRAELRALLADLELEQAAATEIDEADPVANIPADSARHSARPQGVAESSADEDGSCDSLARTQDDDSGREGAGAPDA